MKEKNKIAEAYPLYWPAGYNRSKYSKRSRFRADLTIAKAAGELEAELDRLGAKDVILSTNIELTLSGNPRSGGKKVTDNGVAVYFKRKNNDVVLCCDNYDRVQDNIWAIARTVNALRQISRDGVSDFLDRAFTGFKAIPEKTGLSNLAWWDILEIDENCTYEEAEKQYKLMSKKYHPDYGDTSGRIYLINDAWERAKVCFGI